jgi:hypothetical protein
MKKIKLTLAATTAAFGLATVSYAQQPFVSEAAFFPGTGLGATYDYPNSGPPGGSIGPISVPGVNVSGLNLSSGLGTITYSSTALGAQYFGLFLDMDNDLKTSTAFEDQGSASGTPFSGETWEIGDSTGSSPDPFDDANHDTLANANTMTESPQIGDVAFGLGFDYTMPSAGTETISITSSLTAPRSGFYLEQWNVQDVQNGVSQPNYLYATESFAPAGLPGVPDGGSTMTALAMGMMALAGLKYRFARK